MAAASGFFVICIHRIMDNIILKTQEQELLVNIMDLVAKLGYSGQSKYDKVLVNDNGTYRVTVSDLHTDQLGQVITYNISFDPFNRKGLIFDQYLEKVEIQMIGVNRTSNQKSNYRECSIKMLLRDPKSMIIESKWYILRSDKGSNKTSLGLPWLSKSSMLSGNQVLAVIEILMIESGHGGKSLS